MKFTLFLLVMAGTAFADQYLLAGNASQIILVNSSDIFFVSAFNSSIVQCGLNMVPYDNSSNYSLLDYFDFWCNDFHTSIFALSTPNQSFYYSNYTQEFDCLGNGLTTWIPSYLYVGDELHCAAAWYVPGSNFDDDNEEEYYYYYGGGGANNAGGHNNADSNNNYWFLLLGVGGMCLLVWGFFRRKRKNTL